MLSVRCQLKRLLWYRNLHLAYTGWRTSLGGLPDWKRFLKSDFPCWQRDILHSDRSKMRVLLATGTGGHLPSMTVESLLGVTLKLRSANVDFLLCDGVLSACMMCEANWYSDPTQFAASGPRDRCNQCYQPASKMLRDAGMSLLTFSGQLIELERLQARDLAMSIDAKDISSFKIGGVSIGEHTVAGALRFFARGELTDDSQSDAVLRRYFESALITYYVAKRLLVSGDYTVIVLNHGIYVPQGVIAETARQLGIRVVTWHSAYRRGCFLFNHDETYHQGLLTEPTDAWEKMQWSVEHQHQIEDYLRSRWTGSKDWIKFHKDPKFQKEEIQNEIDIDFSKTTIGLLTNVVWDAQLHYRANAFPNMLEWICKTIAYFGQRAELQLLIRVHPAEITGTVPSRQPVIAEIHRHFPALPSNVFIIPPESRVSTYVAMMQCNSVVIFGTKAGVELTAMGIPVIVAGEAWIRGKGVTLDANTETEYFQLLNSLPLPDRLHEDIRERALKYAYHFFFRRMIPLECMQEKKGWPPFRVAIDGLDDLAPGRSEGLDVICNGILQGTPFIYAAEQKS